jgi:hypothetical protein
LKKTIPYWLLGIVIVAVFVLVFKDGCNSGSNKSFTERVTLRKRDKIPYGTFVAHSQLDKIFPKAEISINKEEPGYWEHIDETNNKQAIIIVAPYFMADEYEIKELVHFAEAGNDVFISSFELSHYAEDIFKCKSRLSDNVSSSKKGNQATLATPPFKGTPNFKYNGRRFETHFTYYDTSFTTVLGRGSSGEPNFIAIASGSGHIYLHSAPLAFSNYFLLQNNNLDYYASVLSVIPANTEKVLWDEYYLGKDELTKDNSKEDEPNFLSAIMKYPGISTGLILGALLLLAYTLLGMRRKQRAIPVMERPKNDSLDFVKTIGRLYYDKGDHTNLGQKMGAYFLEHLRSNYKLPTNELSDDFVQKVEIKTGVPHNEVLHIVTTIIHLRAGMQMSAKDLQQFYLVLEDFYKKA